MAETIALGRSEVRVPRLGLGVMTWGRAAGLQRLNPARSMYGGPDPADEQAAFEASLGAGVHFFDTAAFYSGGASERRLGELAEGRSVVIATKFPARPFARLADFGPTLKASLRRLRRQSVDLYQHHFPVPWIDIRALMAAMAGAVRAGQVRAVGVSNYGAAQLRIAHAALAEHGIALASNQVEYSLLHRRPEADGVLDACRELGVALIAYQPLASGALTGRYLGGARPTGLRRFSGRFRRSALEPLRPVVEELRTIGAGYGKSPAQVALRWLIQTEGVIPIPGAKNADQASHNAAALSFALEPAEMDRLDQLTRRWRR